MSSVQTLLALESSAEQEVWLRENAPVPDAALIADLRAEAQRRERIEPMSALPVAKIVQVAGSLWQDEAVEGLGKHLEANVYYFLGDFATALPFFEATNIRYQALGLIEASAELAASYAGALQFLGRYREAEAIENAAEPILSGYENSVPLAKLLLTRGTTAARQNKFDAAQSYWNRAGALFHAAGEHRFAAMAAVNEANVLTERNAFREAKPLFEAARQTFSEAQMGDAVARTDLNLAYLLAGQGDTQNALRRYNQARNLFAEQNNLREVAHIDLHRSDIYLNLNLWRETLEQVAQAEPTFAAQGMAFEQGRLQLNAAAALAKSGQDASDSLAAARGYFSAENNQLWQAVTDLATANLAYRDSYFTRATELAKLARATFVTYALPNRLAQCDVLLGNIALAQNDLITATFQFESALAALDEIPIPAITYACHHGLATIAQRQGDTVAALTALRIAIDDIERLQASIGAEDYKIAFFSDKLAVYEDLVALCLTINTAESLEEAFQTVERAKSRALLDTIARSRSTTDSNTPDGLNDQLRKLQEELNWYYNQLNTPKSDDSASRRLPSTSTDIATAITQREHALEQLLQSLRSPDLVATPENPIWAVSLSQIQQLLPPNTILLEFFIIENQIVLFRVEAGQVATIQTLPVTLSAIDHHIRKLQFQISKFNLGQPYVTRHARQLERGCNSVLRSLYRKLWEPLAIEAGKTLIIVPHGQLHAIPFQALFDGQHYVLEQHTLSYAPSATVLAQTIEPPNAVEHQQALIIGVADESIPQAMHEAQAIADLLGNSAELRTGEHAKLTNLSQYSLLHLATHAAFRDDNPQFSAIKLADRWITVQEIALLNRTPPLVTLSACETGKHHVSSGDELLGLCRGFFAAGSRTLAVSQWNADDKMTAKLMLKFYQELTSGKPVNQALRTAQLAIKTEASHPYFWAGFTITGQPTYKWSDQHLLSGGYADQTTYN